MQRFAAAYLAASEPASGESAQRELAAQWQRQQPQIAAALREPADASAAAGGLRPLTERDLRLDRRDLAAFCRAMLALFHNMRTALHVPDPPPQTAPPPSGPGRNDAFGVLSAMLLGAPQPPAPVKYGLVWNTAERPWVHWDGNTRSPIGRNMLASLGLGAPLVGRRGLVDFASLARHTELTEQILAPRYPFAIDRAAAAAGAAHYEAKCAACHDGPESDARLHDPAEIGTDPQRARLFTPVQADRFNAFLAQLEIPGYAPGPEPGLRSTQRYQAPSLQGAWARSPYLHNGAVRTMQELLTAPAARAKTFRRGSRVYDAQQMGYTDDGPYVLDTARPGSSNAGHDYGTELSAQQKRELIEYLKTL
jgi:hypothetical protein